MSEYKLGVMESRFADIIWSNEPIPSGQLAKLAEKELNWKRTTSYTILKRLCDRGMFQNVNGIVTSLLSRDDYYSYKTEEFINESFHGSIIEFLTAFSARHKITDEEAEELTRVIRSIAEDK